jgi:bla regulator protein blaR1
MILFNSSAVWAVIGPRIMYLFDHVWQSTAFAAVAALVVFLLRRNQAKTRYWIWLAASAKFLVPFAMLTALGRRFAFPVVHGVRSVRLSVVDTVVYYNRSPFPLLDHPIGLPELTTIVTRLLIGIWFCGFAIVLFSWFKRWRLVTVAVRQAEPMPEGRERDALRRLQHNARVGAPIELVASTSNLEPGVFGIFRPVLLLPAGIADRLDDAQLEAIVAHELCHIRRRDNLAAAFHMMVQAIFWFHPLVWWLGARLVDERERACDEDVLRLGNPPQVYAEGILRVCKFYLESPLVCVAGVTGSNLKKRIEGIMTHRISNRLDLSRKLLLAAFGAAAIAGPIVIGLMNPLRIRAQSASSTTERKNFEVASIKPSEPGGHGIQIMMAPGGRVTAKNVTAKILMQQAYGVRDFQIIGGPSWLGNERYDINAKAGGDDEVSPEQMRTMMQGLLADRFQLVFHRETKDLPMYALVVGKNGSKLKEVAEGNGPQVRMGRGLIQGQGMGMDMFATQLSNALGRSVTNKTGLGASYDIKLEWTPEQSGGMVQRDGGGADAAAPADAGPSIFAALQEQLGLRLESTKGPVTLLVIDKAEKASEN